jgi:hypothetical protein
MPEIYDYSLNRIGGTRPWTIITVTCCANCPFMHTEDETADVCSHPGLDVPREEPYYPTRFLEDKTTVLPDWCPMRKHGDVAVVSLAPGLSTP